MNLLRVENISSGYGKKEIIKDITFEINEGEIVTLAGSNGAGKSTVLKTIYGINEVWNDGKIYFLDEDITGLSSEEMLKKGIVYIGQKNNTFDALTVKENLETAGYLYDKEILKEKIETILESFEMLKTKLDKKPQQLSGGQKQLLALAMGLIHEPKIILFDEPSAGLDVKTMNFIFGIIQTLKEKNGISFLIVEHKVKEIDKISDTFLGLRLGLLEKETNKLEVLKSVFI